ncbi:MAG: chemotaxis response regulator protein-glutamate methylesterase [Acidobacteria bacterium]|nr:chemotaxis response regulator protein-glutamate methylesterase [Acidobacteriota bacterium]
MSAAPLHVPRATLARGGRIRVLVVDDSVVIRHLLRKALEEDPDVEVVGVEGSGVAALARIPQVNPDLVTLDIEMPEMDGLETLRHIRKRFPRLRTIMFSTLTTRGASATFEALSLGADDYVAKHSNAGSLDRSLATLRSELMPKIKQFFALPNPPVPKPEVRPSQAAKTARPANMPRVLGIGVSTGGPQALAAVIPKLPANFRLPIVIVQHMPATFTRLLAERLQSLSRLTVEEAADGMELVPGRVIVARGEHHLRVRRTGKSMVTVLDQSPHVNSCRPSVDVLFRSLAECYRGDVLSAVLTGMGSDGLDGTKALKAAGAYSIVQDQATSVVWGMPGAIAQAGLADRIVPLDLIAAELVRAAGE